MKSRTHKEVKRWLMAKPEPDEPIIPLSQEMAISNIVPPGTQ